MHVLKEQYTLVEGSRQAMLKFISDNVAGQLPMPLPEFNGSSIKYLLIHIINTYVYWIANFSMHQQLPFIDEDSISSLEDLQIQFHKVDELIGSFLANFQDMYLPVSSMLDSGTGLTVSPLQLFSHVITHEFHHKGQIMTMCRLLGKVPTDTDIIRF